MNLRFNFRISLMTKLGSKSTKSVKKTGTKKTEMIEKGKFNAVLLVTFILLAICIFLVIAICYDKYLFTIELFFVGIIYMR